MERPVDERRLARLARQRYRVVCDCGILIPVVGAADAAKIIEVHQDDTGCRPVAEPIRRGEQR